MPQIALYVCRHTVLSSLSTAKDTLLAANQCVGSRLFDLLVVSADGQRVSTPEGQLAVDGDLVRAAQADLLLIPAIGRQVDAAIGHNRVLCDWLTQQPTLHVGSICTGAFLLAASGRLDGQRATTHWAMADEFRRRFPQVRLDSDQLVTQDSGYWCAGGAMAGVDLCLQLVARFGGEWLARQVAALLVMDYGRGGQSRFVPRLPAPQSHDGAIAQLQRWLEQHYAQPLTLADMAAQLSCSPRTLLRRFKDATGLTPNEYVQRVRISAAEHVLRHTDSPVEQVALRVGYENRAAFSRLFKLMTGMSPAAYRQCGVSGARLTC
jgi:transcriptional regulator GlxA family with amidase domain